LKKELRAYIEAELRGYHRTKAELEEIRDNLLNSSPGPTDGMPRGTDTSNPTFKQAVRLMTNRRIKYMEGLIYGIGVVLDELPQDKLRLVELKYWTRPQTRTDQGIAQEIGCDRTTLWRWCEGICLAIAIELGLVDELRENPQQACNN
jgi:RinA family phage transcriptional activator